MTSSDDRVRFLVLGHPVDGRTPWHPVRIAVHPDGVRTRLLISKGGNPHVSVGGQFPVRRVIRDGGPGDFAEELAAAGATWLVPYLVRLADDELVTEDELVRAYAARHGSPPVVELGPITR